MTEEYISSDVVPPADCVFCFYRINTSFVMKWRWNTWILGKLSRSCPPSIPFRNPQTPQHKNERFRVQFGFRLIGQMNSDVTRSERLMCLIFTGFLSSSDDVAHFHFRVECNVTWMFIFYHVSVHFAFVRPFINCWHVQLNHVVALPVQILKRYVVFVWSDGETAEMIGALNRPVKRSKACVCDHFVYIVNSWSSPDNLFIDGFCEAHWVTIMF